MNAAQPTWRVLARCCCCCLALILPSLASAQPQTKPDEPRAASAAPYSPGLHDQSVARWRAGALPSGELIRLLDAWLAEVTDPAQKARLASDRVVVGVQAGLSLEVLAAVPSPDTLAPYALAPFVVAARETGNAEAQAAGVRRMLALDPDGWDARVQEASWRIDQRQLALARESMNALQARNDQSGTGRQVALTELRGALAQAEGDLPAALRYYQDVLAMAPDHRYAWRARAFLLARLGGPEAALVTALAEPDRFTALELAGLRQAALGQRLRWAMRHRDLQPDDPQRFDPLDAVLRDSDVLAADIEARLATAAAPQRDEWERIARGLMADQVLASFERGFYPQTLRRHDALKARAGEVPYYATAAAAGAHAKLRRADLAVPLYEKALREGGDAARVPSDIHVALIYAYVDTGQFAQADALLDQMIERTPVLLKLSPELGRPNNDYGDVLGLRALIALYTDRPALAEREFNVLAGLAPLNEAYRSGQARTLRQRLKPQAAVQAYEEVLTDQPGSIEVRAGYAEALFDTGELGEARRRVDALAQTHPEHSAVRSAVRTRDTLMAPRLDISARAGRDGGTLSSREAGLDARLASGWWQDTWRLFARQQWGQADLVSDRLSAGRTGLGLEGRRGAWEASAELHHTVRGSRNNGIALGLQWRASDAWLLAANWDSNSFDIPWRARQAAVSARQAQAEVTWLFNESRRVTARALQQSFTDGNRRDGAGVAWRERWWSSAKLQFETTLAADTGRNSLQSVPYFSPGREDALALTARAQWLTWKEDERVMLQVLEAGIGRYRQQGFGSGSTSLLRYAHEWNWGAGWLLRYGLGTSTHPYDGESERRREVFIDFSMPLQ